MTRSSVCLDTTILHECVMKSLIGECGFLRSLVWRIGRRLYCWARNDLPAPPNANGEYWLLEACLAEMRGRESFVVLDIGANRGDWSHHALSNDFLTREKLCLHAFEPASDTYAHLRQRFAGTSVVLNHAALSDKTSQVRLYLSGALSGLNSLHGSDDVNSEVVRSIALDEYVKEHQIENIEFIKSDAEGHDIHVMFGAEQTLSRGRVAIWQFEYNHRWIGSRHYLRDVFDFIVDKPYVLGKLYQSGIEIFENWHPELERFFESNYLLIRRDCKWVQKYLRPVRFDSRNVLARYNSRLEACKG